jgi:DNA-binding NarL/FixJ family response regulator
MGLKVLMKDVLPAHTVDEAETGNDAMLLVKEKSYDLCLMDLNIPKTDSLEMIKRFKVMRQEMKILVVSMNNEDVYALNVLKNGAMGFVSKANGYEDIKSAILKVLENKKFMSENIISLLIESESEKLESNPFNRLSERELEISKLICEGHPTKMIAFKTNLQLSTISTYKAKIFEKLQVRNTIELFELSKVHMLLGN